MRRNPTNPTIRRTLAGGCCLLALLAFATVAGADEPQSYYAVEIGGEVVPHINPVDLRDLPTVPDWEPGDPIVLALRKKSLSTHDLALGKLHVEEGSEPGRQAGDRNGNHRQAHEEVGSKPS